MSRFVVLTAAFWCAIFALMNAVQMLVVSVPAHLQPVFVQAWAIAALIYAPIAATIVRKSKS